MAFQLAQNTIGAQQLDQTSTTQTAPLGTVVAGNDPVLGSGLFVYARGVANTVVGSLAVLGANNTTTLSVAASRGPVGISQSINIANQFGWYQITGVGSVVATAAAAAAPVYSTATPGSTSNSVVAGSKVDGATFTGAVAAGFAPVILAYGNMSGN